MNAWVTKRPLTVSMAITSIKACLADVMIQTHVEKCDSVDLKRAGLFWSFGFLYQGCFQYWMYNVLYERLFPGTGIMNVTKKVLLSNLVSDPVFFFPTFYAFKEIINTNSISPRCFTEGIKKYSENYKQDWVNSWMVWLPGYTVTYAVMPIHLRMPWIATVSFGYVSLLSYTRGAYDDKYCEEIVPAQRGKER
jgi:protein Mpv17